MSNASIPPAMVPIPPLPLPAARPRRPRRWLRVLLAFVIFVAGLTCGGAATAVYVAYRFQYALHHPDELPGRLAARLARRLKLDDVQEGQVRQIFASRQKNLHEIRVQFQPEVMTQLEGVHSDVSHVLTQAQRAKWDVLFDDLMRNWMPPMPGAATAP